MRNRYVHCDRMFPRWITSVQVDFECLAFSYSFWLFDFTNSAFTDGWLLLITGLFFFICTPWCDYNSCLRLLDSKLGALGSHQKKYWYPSNRQHVGRDRSKLSVLPHILCFHYTPSSQVQGFCSISRHWRFRSGVQLAWFTVYYQETTTTTYSDHPSDWP